MKHSQHSTRPRAPLGLLLLVMAGAIFVLLPSCNEEEPSTQHPPGGHLLHGGQLAHREHLRLWMEQHGIQLPASDYDSAAVELDEDELRYSGSYVPACLGRDGNVVRFDGTAARVPADGELLTLAAGDPAIKDRSLSALAARWQPYLDGDFRYDCWLEGLNEPQLCSPVTYYYDYQRYLEQGDAGTVPEPTPHLYLYIPSHMTLAASAQEDRWKEIFDAIGRVRAIQDQRSRLLELHKLISWLKGDSRITTVAGTTVRELYNNHVSGMGKLFLPAMMFAANPGGSLPEPSLPVAVPDALRKLMSANPDYSSTYTATFRVGQSSEEHRAFVRGTPWSGTYEDLRYTDDPLTLSGFQLTVDPQKGENVTASGGNPGQVLRGLIYASSISTTRDALGRPVLNGHVQRPPSGLCLEEATFFLHTSMLHTFDGWGVAAWSNEDPMMVSLASDFLGDGGLCETWNQKYGGYEQQYGQKMTVPCVMPISHVEIFDSHIFIPHARIDLVRQRLKAIEDAYASNVQSAAGWKQLGYKVPASWPCSASQPCPGNPCGAILCTEDNLRILQDTECGGSATCEQTLISVFQSAYMGPATRTLTSLAPEHALDSSRAAAMNEMWNDPFAETVKDTVCCRAGIDDVIIHDASCTFDDRTVPPPSAYGKATVPAEPALFQFNHLWLYGSMHPIHEPSGEDKHLPRYWSTHGSRDPDLVGLVSFRHFTRTADTWPTPELHGAAWFVTDRHGYFREEIASSENLFVNGRIDLGKVVRSGRGDPMYLLQYAPKRFLDWKSDDPDWGTNLPDPSFPRTAAGGCP